MISWETMQNIRMFRNSTVRKLHASLTVSCFPLYLTGSSRVPWSFLSIVYRAQLCWRKSLVRAGNMYLGWVLLYVLAEYFCTKSYLSWHVYDCTNLVPNVFVARIERAFFFAFLRASTCLSVFEKWLICRKKSWRYLHCTLWRIKYPLKRLPSKMFVRFSFSRYYCFW